MTNKTMPERIYACRDTVVDAWGGTVEEGWHTVPQFDEEVEYVRADLVADDPDDPLADGQYRWIKEKNDDLWQPALVSWYGVGGECGFDGYEFYVMTEDYEPIDYDDVIAIGPVIRPPEEKN